MNAALKKIHTPYNEFNLNEDSEIGNLLVLGIESRVQDFLREFGIKGDVYFSRQSHLRKQTEREMQHNILHVSELLSARIHGNIEVCLVAAYGKDICRKKSKLCLDIPTQFKIIVTLSGADFFAPCSVYDENPMIAEAQLLSRIKLISKRVVR